eukprot:jgi/Ulvmu1/10834/UM007_0008.1
MDMEGVRRELARAIDWLQGDVEERHYQAAMLIRIAVADAERKKVAQDLEAVLAIVPMLKYGVKHPTTMVAVEALACMVTQDPKGRDQLRSTNAHEQLVDMLQRNPRSDLAHRILLVFQNLADKEADRKLLVSFDCAAALKPFLVSTYSPEVVEHALSTVCNLAAGSQMAKAHICDSGLIPPLLMFLAPHCDGHLAQLAALSLRNLSRHADSKAEIMKNGGVSALLEFLSEGLEALQYPLHCDILYQKGSQAVTTASQPGLLAIDIDRGQLILSPETATGGICSCLSGGAPRDPIPLHRDATAERYPLLMTALRFTTPHDSQLELQFDVDGRGAERLGHSSKDGARLMRVVINECDAHELSELITRLLNKLYTQQDFRPAQVSPQASVARMSLIAAQPTVLPSQTTAT